MAVLTQNSDKTQWCKTAIELYCWCWSTVLSEVQSQHCHQSKDFGALRACVGWQALWRWWFILARSTWHLPTEPKLPITGVLTMVLLGLTDQPTGLTSTPQRICVELSRGRWETPDPTTQMSLRQLSKQSWASITHQQYHRLITSLPRPFDEECCSKLFQTKYWVLH